MWKLIYIERIQIKNAVQFNLNYSTKDGPTHVHWTERVRAQEASNNQIHINPTKSTKILYKYD